MSRASMVAAGILLAAAAGLAGSARDHGPPVQVRVDGRPLPVTGEMRYGRVYADALALARALGLRAVFFPDKPEQGLTLQGGERFVHLHTDQNDCHVGGMTVQLDAPSLYLHPRTGAPMAPVALVVEAFGGTVTVREAAAGGPAALDVRSPGGP